MRAYQTDYRLWAVLFCPAFFGIGFLSDPYDQLPHSLWGMWFRWIARGGGSADEFGMLVILTLAAFPLAFGLSWIAHAAALVFGLRLRAQPDKSQVADYNDNPPSQSTS